MSTVKMRAATKDKLRELELIVSKMSLQMCWLTVLPEFAVQWSQVARAVRNCRLPMVPGSVARVLCKHAARSLLDEDLSDIVARLRLKFVATQERKWYVIDLLEPIGRETSVANQINLIPSRVANALKKNRAGQTKTPQVTTACLGDYLFISVQLISATNEGPVLYVAHPPGEPVALVSSVTSSLLKGCVEGLGYRKHEDAQLFGRDIKSLLRIHNRNHNENINHLSSIPEYNPVPVITTTGIDYTNKTYNETYVDNILGPDPPLLTDLLINSTKSFFDPSRLKRQISLTAQLKSDDVAKTLKGWVAARAIAPTSDFFQIFHVVKSNKIAIANDENE